MTHPLLQGFGKFHAEQYECHKGVMPTLVENGQSPDYFIISCIDSRSDPGTIFKPAPGVFFAHKAMGAIVRPYTKGTALAAALQFALNYNKVKEIIVLGHTGCGAIEALAEKLDDEEIASFVEVAREGFNRAHKNCSAITCTHDELLRHTEQQITLQSIRNLGTYPSVRKALDENRVILRPWLFDMHSGDLLEYSDTLKEFTPIS